MSQTALLVPNLKLSTRPPLSHPNTMQQVTSCGLAAQEAAPHVTAVSVTNQGAQLAFWPPALCTFTALSSINLSGNAITFIPQSVQALTGLKVQRLLQTLCLQQHT